MVRGLLAVLAGFLLATSLSTYCGIGINILFFAVDRGIPQQGNSLSNIVGIYSMAMTILLLGLSLLLLTEFTRWKFQVPARTGVDSRALAAGALIHSFRSISERSAHP